MPGKIKIFFAYRHVDKPWGGANNFMRALNREVRSTENFEVLESIQGDYDIFFMNQLGVGPGAGAGKHWDLKNVRKMLSEKKCKLVVRAVNVKMKVRLEGGLRTLIKDYLQDRKVVRLLNEADLVVFQSHYQHGIFVAAGFSGSNYKVIHNGADPVFWIEQPKYQEVTNLLRIVSSSFSDRAFKRHDIIAAISLLPDVEVVHVGNWPKGVESSKVKLVGVLGSEEMRTLMENCHYFLHPAYLDACPNSVVEALNVGLPVIYNPAPGSSAELVGEAGIALNESDLMGTVVTARRELDRCRLKVLQQREQFCMHRVAEAYMAAFQSVMVGN